MEKRPSIANILATMSFELRTSLNTIVGYSEVLLNGLNGPLNEMQREDIATIYHNGRSLLNLMDYLIDYAKIENGMMVLEAKHFDLKQVIEAVANGSQEYAGEKPVKIKREIDDNLPRAFGDETRTQQILHNLLANAIHFTNQGSITVSASCNHDAPTSDRKITVRVTDQGVGIVKEDVPRVFAEGVGISLSLIEPLIKLQGGRIWVESPPEGGSTFSFTIPTQPPQEMKPGD